MTYNDFHDEILGLPVWDTHTHLETSKRIGAVDFWNLVHYFWHLRELSACGYPGPKADLSEDERIEAFLNAFQLSRNTYWNLMVRSMLKDLYGVEITDKRSVAKANEVIIGAGQARDWAQNVTDRLNIKTITVALTEPNDLDRIANKIHVVPVYGGLGAKLKNVLAAADQRDAATAAVTDIAAAIDALAAQGYKSLRIEPYPFLGLPGDFGDVPELKRGDNASESVQCFLGHKLMEALDRNGMHIQFFIGMRRGAPTVDTSLNDPNLIPNMHILFQRYTRVRFELLLGAELSAMDLVQAARLYPNVYPGALWWFNFRASTYRANIQCRVEALPAIRTTLLASDSRQIEWCYGKTLMVKRLIAEVLWGEVQKGWLDRDTAIHAAKAWLHDSAAALAAPQKPPVKG